jgi:integrase
MSLMAEAPGRPRRCIDIETGRLSVEQQLVPTRGGVTFGPPKTKRSRRTVALDEETVEALRAQREAQLFERAFLGEGYVDHDVIFAREDGEPIHPQRLTEAFGKHAKAAKLSPLRLHGPAARRRCPHRRDPRVLPATYAHLLPHSDAEAAQRAAALIAVA